MYGFELPLHWDPLTATVEIWTGQNLDRLQFVADSLKEIGIPSRRLTDDPQNLRLLVQPEDEASAREIVRQILEAAAPERSIVGAESEVWHDQPVRSWLFAWLPGVIYFAVVLYVYAAEAPPGELLRQYSSLDPLFSLVRWMSDIAFLWILYQAARYEIRPLRFVLLGFLPFSFIWYYYERYSRRRGYQRLPIAVRERISPRPSA
jgi:hypothetical protein